MWLGLDLNPLTQQERPVFVFGVTHDRKGWAIPSALAQCELEGFGWTWSSSGVSDCAFPISLNVFGIVAVVLDSQASSPRQGAISSTRLVNLVILIIDSALICFICCVVVCCVIVGCYNYCLHHKSFSEVLHVL